MGRERKNQGVFEKLPGSGVWWVEWFEGKKRHRRKIGSKEFAKAFAEQMRRWSASKRAPRQGPFQPARDARRAAR